MNTHAIYRLRITLLFAIGLFAWPAWGQGNEEATPLPEGGVSVLPAGLPESGGFWAGSNGGEAIGRREFVDVSHSSFERAIRILVDSPSGEYWNGAVQISSTQSVATGDVLLVRLFMRSIESADESGLGLATVFPQGPAPDYTKYLVREITSTDEWVEYLLPFEMTESLPSGGLSLQIGFGAGSKTQIFEIGGLEVINYKTQYSFEELPQTLPSYEGRALDAEWRVAAAERIEANRKGDLSICVLDSSGGVASGAIVSVQMLRHEYHFGSVIAASRLMGTGADSEIYREKVLEYFNQSGTENDLKWAPWEGEWGSNFNRSQTLEALQWLQDRDIYTRGHVMVWPSKRNLPNLIQSFLPENDPSSADPAAKQVVLDHIVEIADFTKDHLDEWDVLNEPFDNHYLMDAFGNEVMVDWFEEARSVLPEHGLYLNDYSILSGGGRNAAHQQHFQDTAQYLKDNDAPITGLGMQGHFGSSPTSIPLVYSLLERYHGAFPELDIRVTEFDVSTDDEGMQADYVRDFLTVMFSHSATVGVQLWGFWAGQHWRPKAALFDEDWREKPAAAAWKDLVYEEWWNDFQGNCDENGEYNFRGYYGDYAVRIEAGSEIFEFDCRLGKDGVDRLVVNLNSLNDGDGKRLAVSVDGDANAFAVSDFSDNGQAIEVEQSSDLRDWFPAFNVDSPSPGVVYEKLIELGETGAVFVRKISHETE